MVWQKRKAAAAVENENFIPLGVRSKKAKFLDESASEEDDFVAEEGLTINEEFARRFEHNKKRAELHRLEEKYGKSTGANDGKASETDSSSDEEEDDEGEFVTEDVDAEIAATLQAIRSKDPKVYDTNTRFFTTLDDATNSNGAAKRKDKGMTLKEYHQKNLLGGGSDLEEDDVEVPYARQQAALKRSLVDEMHAAADEDDSDEDDNGEDKDATFLKPVKRHSPAPAQNIPDPALAERDPETFLSNFLASRAWVPTETSRFAALESDDEEEEVRAEAFEEYYNLRFEDPGLANKKLVSYARDAIAARSVRRDDKSVRKRARDKEREKKDAERQERDEERALLRKLKLEEMEEKVKRIREAAGSSGKDFKIDDWIGVLDADWDDDQWDKAMHDRFGESYYAKNDALGEGSEEEDDEAQTISTTKLKKPKWDDDIDIGDLIPDFDAGEEINPELRLSDPDSDSNSDSENEISVPADHETGATKKSQRTLKAATKASSRRDHRILTALVDQSLPLAVPQPGSKASAATGFTPFRYRETSPTTFGLTPLDILGATDAQLNEFAGLKKLAPFRDEERKRRDRKKLGKRARLRQWRRETFGDEEGVDPASLFRGGDVDGGDGGGRGGACVGDEVVVGGVDIRGEEGERKKKRKKRGKKGKGM